MGYLSSVKAHKKGESGCRFANHELLHTMATGAFAGDCIEFCEQFEYNEITSRRGWAR